MMSSSVDPIIVQKACAALLSHMRKDVAPTLFEDSTALSLEIRLMSMPGRSKSKPVQM